MTFGEFLHELRKARGMTLRQLGEKAGQDYVVLNKIERGQRMAPPLEAIIALADALASVRKLAQGDFEKLLDLAARPNDKADPRFTEPEVERLKSSPVAEAFFTRRPRKRER